MQRVCMYGMAAMAVNCAAFAAMLAMLAMPANRPTLCSCTPQAPPPAPPGAGLALPGARRCRRCSFLLSSRVRAAWDLPIRLCPRVMFMLLIAILAGRPLLYKFIIINNTRAAGLHYTPCDLPFRIIT